MIKLNCGTCKKQFEALDDSNTEEPICYGCALDSITGGRAPEEGDFNSARIISGEMSEKEWKWLQEDLRAAETGRSIREYEEIEYDELIECNDDDEYCDECGDKVETGHKLCTYCAAAGGDPTHP